MALDLDQILGRVRQKRSLDLDDVIARVGRSGGAPQAAPGAALDLSVLTSHRSLMGAGKRYLARLYDGRTGSVGYTFEGKKRYLDLKVEPAVVWWPETGHSAITDGYALYHLPRGSKRKPKADAPDATVLRDAARTHSAARVELCVALTDSSAPVWLILWGGDGKPLVVLDPVRMAALLFSFGDPETPVAVELGDPGKPITVQPLDGRDKLLIMGLLDWEGRI